jgi:2-phospho-L-lactate guanylyltransferase (CobY/MobA/RfbA family)
MSVLLIPVAPLTRTKSRLRDCFSNEQLKDLTIAMFKDLCNTLKNVTCFDQIIVYCNTPEILELAKDYNLIGIKEELLSPRKSFDEVIEDLNMIAIKKYNAEQTVFSFLDLILISSDNFYEINQLIQENQLVICPAIHSAGISIFGRNPPDIIPSFFSDPNIPSLVALLNNAYQEGIDKIAVYDSFRAGFDIDIKHDLVLGYEYLKILNLKDTNVFRFLKNNLKLALKKTNANNNRSFKITKRKF